MDFIYQSLIPISQIFKANLKNYKPRKMKNYGVSKASSKLFKLKTRGMKTWSRLNKGNFDRNFKSIPTNDCVIDSWIDSLTTMRPCSSRWTPTALS